MHKSITCHGLSIRGVNFAYVDINFYVFAQI